MMPQIGFTEMLLLGILALVVIGPKELPLMMRKFGRFSGKLRAMAWEFQQSFDELGRQAELEELRKEVESLKRDSGIEQIKKDFDSTKADLEKDAREMEKSISEADAKTSEPEEKPAQTPLSEADTPTETKVTQKGVAE